MALGRQPTSLLFIGTVLSFFGGSLAASTNSTSNEEPFELTPECEPVTRFRQCWNNYDSLPSCGNEKSLTLTCAERVGHSLVKCDQDLVMKYSTDLIKAFRASDNVLCANNDLYEVFKNDGYCWRLARNCEKIKLFSKTYVYQFEQNHNECHEDASQYCMKRVQQYSKALLGEHPCWIPTTPSTSPSGGFVGPLGAAIALLLFGSFIALLCCAIKLTTYLHNKKSNRMIKTIY